MPPPHFTEAQAFAKQICADLRRFADNLEQIPAEHMDTRLLEDGNTPSSLTHHIIGNAGASILGIARERPDEFLREGGTPERLAQMVRDFATEVEEALLATTPEWWNQTLVPPLVSKRSGVVPQPVSHRVPLYFTLGHLAEHLGELFFIKDTLAQREGRYESKNPGAMPASPGRPPVTVPSDV